MSEPRHLRPLARRCVSVPRRAAPSAQSARCRAPTPRPAAQPTPGDATAAARRIHDHDQAIVVTGVRRRRRTCSAACRCSTRRSSPATLRPSIGETLAQQPGVSATSFGPTASAPVLRGLSGDRVRVLTDGIGTLDLSSAGPDHAISINPLTAERIEVLRGPAALLFGSSAIGGVVNVIDTRIPRRVPDGRGRRRTRWRNMAAPPTSAPATSRSMSRSAAISSLHADGNISKTDDLRTGGYILSKALREQARGQRRSGHPGARRPQGQAAQFRSRESKRRRARPRLCRRRSQRRRVGHPPHAEISGADPLFARSRRRGRSADHRPGADPLRRPRRNPARRLLQPGPRARRLCRLSPRRARGHRRDRLELLQQGRRGPGRAGPGRPLGLGRDQRRPISQPQREDPRRGEIPARQPPEADRPVHAADLCQRPAGGSKAARGSSSASSPPRPTSSSARRRHALDFTTFSGSLGGQYEFAPGWRAGLSLSHSERAPSIDELFANGPHGAQPVVRDRQSRPRARNAATRSSCRCTGRPARST